VVVPDVSQDPRYIKVVEDVRSEAAIPMLLKERCIGVFDLESPELDAFAKRDIEILTLLASQAAVAIENARLYEQVSRNEARMEKGAAVRPSRADGAAAHAAAQAAQGRGRVRAIRARARARRRLPRFPDARVQHAHRRAGRRLGQRRAGCALQRVSPASSYVAARSGAASCPNGPTPAAVLSSINTILHERQLEEYYCTMCYAVFDMKKRTVTIANSALPYPVRVTAARRA
jgi:sigma-B regulation protein RsbU (phosphoserine phosphatase)